MSKDRHGHDLSPRDLHPTPSHTRPLVLPESGYLCLAISGASKIPPLKENLGKKRGVD